MNKQSLENAIEGALMAHKSAVWWQEEMNSALAALNRLENSNPFGAGTPPPWSSASEEPLEEREALESKIECLMIKGQWEDNNLDQIMRRMERMTTEEKGHIISEIHKRWALQKSQLGTSP